MAVYRLVCRGSASNDIFNLIYDTKSMSIPKKPLDAYYPYIPEQLTVLLGLKCNLSCRYCIQKNKNNTDFVHSIDFTPHKIGAFIDKLKYIDTSKIEVLNFWGGESLLYFKTIKAVLPKIKELCPKLHKILIATNSTLLNEDILEWANDNKVLFQISDDGVNESRDGVSDVIDNSRSLIDNWNRTHFKRIVFNHAVLTKDSPDLVELCSYMSKHYSNTRLQLSFTTPFIPRHEADINLSYFNNYPIDNLYLLHDSIYEAYVEKKINLFIFKNKTALSSLERILDNFINPKAEPTCNCHENKRGITMDWMGNLYFCRESISEQSIVCTSEEFGDYGKLLLGHPEFHRIDEKMECKRCVVYNICKGSCSAYNAEQTKINCITKFPMFLGLLRAAFKLIKNIDIINIIPESDDCYITDNMIKIMSHIPNYGESRSKVKRILPIHSM